MQPNEVEKNHLIFNITTIFIVFLMDSVARSFQPVKGELLGVIFYVFFLTFMTTSLTLIVYIRFAEIFLGQKYSSKNPLGLGDLNLPASAIIATFILNYMYDITKQYISDSWIAFLFLIPLTFIVYLAVYKFNNLISESMFRTH